MKKGNTMSDWSEITRQILEERGASRFYSNVFYRDSVDSSNEWVKELGEVHFPEGTVGIADAQTAGKGRRGRTWVSPSGENIYFSLLLRPEFSPEHAAALTLVMGLSVAQAIREVTDLLVGIKWPNDVVINHKKVCGILTEMNAEVGKIHYVVIGTGINVNQTEFAEEIRNMATSIKIESGDNDADRGVLLAHVLLYFKENYLKYCETEDVSLLINSYNDLLVSRGLQVRIEDPKGEYIAISRGITRTGGLVVECEDGSTREITSGEISVRGLYGYT